MSWLESIPTRILVSSDRYFEFRTDPQDETKEQARRRESNTYEYRGITEDLADEMLVGYPTLSQGNLTSRSASAIGGGGYTVTETTDLAVSNWLTVE